MSTFIASSFFFLYSFLFERQILLLLYFCIILLSYPIVINRWGFPSLNVLEQLPSEILTEMEENGQLCLILQLQMRRRASNQNRMCCYFQALLINVRDASFQCSVQIVIMNNGCSTPPRDVPSNVFFVCQVQYWLHVYRHTHDSHSIWPISTIFHLLLVCIQTSSLSLMCRLNTPNVD